MYSIDESPTPMAWPAYALAVFFLLPMALALVTVLAMGQALKWAAHLWRLWSSEGGLFAGPSPSPKVASLVSSACVCDSSSDGAEEPKNVSSSIVYPSRLVLVNGQARRTTKSKRMPPSPVRKAVDID